MLRNSREHPLVRRAFPADVADGVFRLWAERDALLEALNRLPRAFCHLDAFGRNLFARRGADGRHQTVAIDWCYVGTGAIGEEIVPLVSGGLLFGDLELDKAPELDTIVFDGYVEGLREAGWRGDRRMVRFVYTAASALRYGIGYPQLELPVLLDESRHAWAEQLMGRPMEEVADQDAECRRFLLGLADEARGLLGSPG